MKDINIIALSDVHLRSRNPIARKDNIIAIQFEKLGYIFSYASDHNCIILQAGDFTDTARSWQLLSNLISFFEAYPKVKFYQVLGQHDPYYYSSTSGNIVGILEKMGFITILKPDKPVIIESPLQSENWYIWGHNWEGKIPVPNKKRNNILVTHDSISKDILFPNQKYSPPKKFLRRNKAFKIIIVGDIHQSFIEFTRKQFIINTGPMLRAEATEYNMKIHEPHFYHIVIRNGKPILHKKIIIPHEHSSKVLSRTHIDNKKKEAIDIEDLTNAIKKANPEKLTQSRISKLINDTSLKRRVRTYLREIYQRCQ